MRKFITLLVLSALLFGLSSCFDDSQPYISSTSVSGELDSLVIQKTDTLWYLTMRCGNVALGYGREVCLALNVKEGSETLYSGNWECGADYLDRTEDTFVPAWLDDDGKLQGSYVAVNEGVEYQYGIYPLSAGKLTLSKSEDLYDVNFSSIMMSDSYTLSFTFSGKKLKLGVYDPSSEGEEEGEERIN